MIVEDSMVFYRPCSGSFFINEPYMAAPLEISSGIAEKLNERPHQTDGSKMAFSTLLMR